jgi:hypothetical protein
LVRRKRSRRRIRRKHSRKFKVAIADAIAEARQAGVWPAVLGNYLEIHAVNLGAQQARR